MKRRNKLKKLEARINAYEDTLNSRDGRGRVNASSFHKPGSMTK